MNFERNIERIGSASVDIDLFVVPWDSEIFGFAVAQIERFAIRRGGDHTDAMRQLRDWLDKENVSLASCRLPSGKLRESMLLEANGFRFVEMVYEPTLSPLPKIECTDENLVIAEALPKDLPGIEAIAANAFTTGRFFIDWRLDGEASNRRYQYWVRNSFDGARQKVLKASIGDDLVGFFIVEHLPDHSAYWHLTAISPEWQGKGLGKRLWGAMVGRHRAEGLSRIDTTISAHNTAVMNIYAWLGFKFNAPQMTFHWVRA